MDFNLICVADFSFVSRLVKHTFKIENTELFEVCAD